MIRSTRNPIAIAFILAVLSVAPALLWAGGAEDVRLGASAAGVPIDANDEDPGNPFPLIVAGDFNRDGFADLAEVKSASGDLAIHSVLVVLLGQADGSFKPAASTPLPLLDPQSIIVGDFNRDGNPDLIVADGDGTLFELLGDGKGNLLPAGAIAHLGAAHSIAMGDFNHDGILDLAVSDSLSNAVTVLLGAGDGSFRPAWSFALPMRGQLFRLAAADFNGDGIADLVVTNEDDDTYEVMLGNGNGTFTFAPELSNLKDPNAHCPA